MINELNLIAKILEKKYAKKTLSRPYRVGDLCESNSEFVIDGQGYITSRTTDRPMPVLILRHFYSVSDNTFTDHTIYASDARFAILAEDATPANIRLVKNALYISDVLRNNIRAFYVNQYLQISITKPKVTLDVTN